MFVDNTWNDDFHSPTTWYANDIIALENVGTGTSFGAPIFTAYVDHIQESNNDSAASLSAVSGITNGFWDNNYATEYNGYIVIPQTGSNYVFEVCGTTGTGACAGGAVDDAAQMWIDKNNDGLLDDSERIINTVLASATSASQSLTAGNVRFRVRFKEVSSTANLRVTIQSSSAPVIAERELVSTDYRVEAPLALWLKAGNGAYDDWWTTKADLAVNNDKVNTWENSGLIPNNDIVHAQSFVDGTGMNFNDANSANAINFNPTLGNGVTPLIRANADNGTQDTNDYFGYPNGLAYIGGANTNFFVGMDSSISGSEGFYSYGYDDNAGGTTAAAATFLRSVSSGSVEIGQHSENTVVSNPGVLVSSVPFSVTGNTAAVLAPATAPDDVVQTVFAYGLQRDQATQNQRLSVGGNNLTSYELGDWKDQSGHDYNGMTAEVIHYPAELSGTERYKVESYLAVKYGLTLSNANMNGTESVTEGDYLSSAGTVIWDGDDTSIQTATFLSSFSVAAQNTAPQSVRFNNDGTRMYITGTTAVASAFQYTLGTAYDISTAGTPVTFALNGQDTAPQSLTFSPDGTKMYVAGSTNANIYQYTLSTPWSLASASYASKFISVTPQDATPQ